MQSPTPSDWIIDPTLAVFVQGLEHPTILVTTQGIIALTNQAFSDLFGPKNYIAQNVSSLIWSERTVANHDQYMKSSLEGIPPHSSKVIGVADRRLFAKHSDGSKMPITLRIDVLHQKDGTFFVATFRLRKMALEDYMFCTKIGTGSFGTVWCARDGTEEVAIKIISKDTIKNVETVLHEEQVLRKGSPHPFIITCRTTFHDNLNIYFVMDLAPGGDLEKYMRGRTLCEKEVVVYMTELMLGIEFLHEKDIILRDIKLENILLSAQGHVRLCDFGVSTTTLELTTTLCGTPDYMAPEMLQGVPYSNKVDIWALGCVGHELLIGSMPWETEPTFLEQVEPADGPLCRRMLHRMLSPNPLDRPSIKALRADPFFHGINWKDVLDEKLVPPIIPIAKSSSRSSLRRKLHLALQASTKGF